MTLEQQVCSLELSKELKELGYPQESLFWYSPYVEIGGRSRPSFKLEYRTGVKSNRVISISAPTVAELGQELAMVEHEKVLEAYGYVVGAIGTQIITTAGLVMAMHRPDMGAKMLIYLLKNKLIELK